MDDKIIEAVVTAIGCSWEEAERFLESESGCYTSIGGESHWLSGELIRRILEEML